MSGIPPIAHYEMPASIDLPANIAQWSIDPDRTVLLIHDMQRYFVQPFDSQHKSQLIKNISLIRERSRSQGVPVAYSAQPGGMTSKQRGLLNDFWGPGMKVDPEERKIVEELSPTSDDWILTKWRYSAFFKSGLLERMREAGRDQLLLCGVYAHLGVLFTAVEAYTNDIQTFLVADAVADFSEKHHRLALEYAAKCCAVVCPTEEVLT